MYEDHDAGKIDPGQIESADARLGPAATAAHPAPDKKEEAAAKSAEDKKDAKQDAQQDAAEKEPPAPFPAQFPGKKNPSNQ